MTDELHDHANEPVAGADPDQAESEQAQALPQPTFQTHLFHLASQVSVALGEIENPVTGSRETDLRIARFLIDTIAMLEEKTRNNRSDDEETYVTGVLTNLRMSFVKKSGERAG